jgi:uncharacterized protein (TIGR02300 family)
MKALRGTKRVCLGCETRFYDLARDPIICPACGVQHVPDTPQAPGARAARFTDKTGWRSKTFKAPEREPGDAQDDAPEVIAADDDAPEEEALAPDPGEDVVLDEEADEGDLSDLVDHRDPKES